MNGYGFRRDGNNEKATFWSPQIDDSSSSSVDISAYLGKPPSETGSLTGASICERKWKYTQANCEDNSPMKLDGEASCESQKEIDETNCKGLQEPEEIGGESESLKVLGLQTDFNEEINSDDDQEAQSYCSNKSISILDLEKTGGDIPNEIFLNDLFLKRHHRVHEIYRKLEALKNRNKPVEVKEKDDSCLLSFVRLFGGIVVVGSITAVIFDTSHYRYISSNLTRFLQWVEENPNLGIFPIAGIVCLATVFFVPIERIALGCGYIYPHKAYGMVDGIVLSVVVIFVGGALGGIISYLLGRFVLRKWFRRLVSEGKNSYPSLSALEKVLKTKRGLVPMICFRLSILVPLSVTNYLFSFSAISLAQFCLALLGNFPSIIVYVIVGVLMSASLEDSATKYKYLISLPVIVTSIATAFIGVLYTFYQVRRELWKTKQETKQTKKSSSQRNVKDSSQTVDGSFLNDLGNSHPSLQFYFSTTSSNDLYFLEEDVLGQVEEASKLFLVEATSKEQKNITDTPTTPTEIHHQEEENKDEELANLSFGNRQWIEPNTITTIKDNS